MRPYARLDVVDVYSKSQHREEDLGLKYALPVYGMTQRVSNDTTGDSLFATNFPGAKRD